MYSEGEKDMKASVILPVLNEEKHIREAMESLVNQDMKDFEIVVVDGKSTDMTLEIIGKFRREYKRPRIRIIVNDNLGTTSANFNLGVHISDTDYIISFLGHATCMTNYVSSLLEKCMVSDENTIAIASPFFYKYENWKQHLFGMIMSSEFYNRGHGSYLLYKEKKPIEVNGSGFYCAKKHLLEKFLPSDNLVVGNDSSLFSAIKKSKYKVILNPNTMAYYYPRDSFTKFFKQQWEFIRFKILGR